MRTPAILILAMPARTDTASSWGLGRIPGHAFSLIPDPCITRLRRLGCTVCVMASTRDDEEIETALGTADGVLLLGGEDVSSDQWGGGEADCVAPSRERDAFELAVVRSATGRRLPVLGICRGAQLLNVALGGTLIPHVELHRSDSGGITTHRVHVAAAFAQQADWPGEVDIASAHHQAIDRLAPPMCAVGYDPDGLIEAAVSDAPPALAVQWHPEFMPDGEVGAWLPFAWLARAVGAGTPRGKGTEAAADRARDEALTGVGLRLP